MFEDRSQSSTSDDLSHRTGVTIDRGLYLPLVNIARIHTGRCAVHERFGTVGLVHILGGFPGWRDRGMIVA